MGTQTPDVAALRELNDTDPVARAFFRHAAQRQRDQSETKVDRILVLLKAEGHDFSRRDVIGMFRKLQGLDCGQFVEGRRGWPSRFVWATGLTSVGRVATGKSEPISRILVEAGDSTGESVPGGLDSDSIYRGDQGDSEEIGEVGGTGLDDEEDPDSGFEITEPFDPSRIRVDTKPMVISLLMDRIRNGEIDLTPGFQRKAGLWSRKAKSQLIESLLVRIPLPAFYMDGGDESHWLVVDGLQRLSTLRSFVIDRAMTLEGLEFLGATCNGLSFDRLPRALQRRILETQVTVFLIQENTPPEVKFNIFKRINTGGLPLSNQEIRHALNQGRACSVLGELAESAEFQTATDHGIRDDRMGDRECVLRFLAFMRTPYTEYKATSIDTFLNQCMRDLNKVPDSALNDVAGRFKRAMVDCFRIFGDRAFRKQQPGNARRFPINRALFEVWASNIEVLSSGAVTLLVERRDALARRFLTLLESPAFAASISFGTGDPQKVKIRFTEIARIIAETLQ